MGHPGSGVAAQDEVARTVDHLRSSLGEDVWTAGMNPDIPEQSAMDNPLPVHRLRLGLRDLEAALSGQLWRA